MSIVQGGIGFPVLHPGVYSYIWSGIYVGAVICDDGIMQTSFRELVKKVNKPYEQNEQLYILKNSFESVKMTLVLGKYLVKLNI